MSLENSQNEILVCIPAFNSQSSVRETLQSILAQRYRNFDILVVDNHSTDATLSIVRKFKDEFDAQGKIYILENKENIGRVGNWNQCLKVFRKTSHKYLKFVFTGDTIEADCLQKLFNIFQQYPRIGFVSSGYYIHDANNGVVEKVSFKESRLITSLNALKLFLQNGNWVGAPVSCMFSREAACSQNFSEQLDWTADWKFYIDIVSAFGSFYTTELLSRFHVSQRKHYLQYKADLSTIGKEFFMYCHIVKSIFHMKLRYFLHFLKIAKLHFFQWLMLSGSQRYAYMQKLFYNQRASLSGDCVVGSYEEHNFWKDYDEYLMKYVDDSFKDALVLDFGCGPGRNIIKYANRFKRLDGVDISEKNIENAKENLALHGITNSKLYVNNGIDLKGMPSSEYDFVMSTICMQHICVYSTRYSLLEEFFRVLKKGGRISIQMGYGKNAPDSVPYEANNINAFTTNRGCDTRVESQEQIKKDLDAIGFTNFEYWIRPTGPGDTHPNWIFFTAKK